MPRSASLALIMASTLVLASCASGGSDDLDEIVTVVARDITSAEEPDAPSAPTRAGHLVHVDDVRSDGDRILAVMRPADRAGGARPGVLADPADGESALVVGAGGGSPAASVELPVGDDVTVTVGGRVAAGPQALEATIDQASGPGELIWEVTVRGGEVVELTAPGAGGGSAAR